METMDAPRFPVCALVDAHVHIHPCFPLDSFFDEALANFRRAARSLDLAGAIGCLLLTEMAGSHWLHEAPGTVGAWTLGSTGEEDSLVARRSSGESLIVVGGRQIVAHERLEVLALGRNVDIPDGLPLNETLQRVREGGALPVLPWGFGKWSGRRGALVAATLARPGGELYLGDNSNRLQLAGVPRLLREAGERGILVLPGTDPLPFPNHAGRAGSFGFVLEGPLEGTLDTLRPAEDLLRRVRALREQPRTYGRGETLPRFLRDQASLQLRQVSA
jgi:hypothetical protein